jgi:hypothetical protein
MILQRLLAFWRASRLIDDRVRSIPRPDQSDVRAQEAIDAELSDRRAVPWANARASIRGDVLRRIQAKRLERTHRRARVVSPRSGLLVAALIAVALIPAYRKLIPLAARSQAVKAIATDSELPEGLDLLGGFASASPMLRDRVDEPLRREAFALQDDTERAARAIFDRLTIDVQPQELGELPAP